MIDLGSEVDEMNPDFAKKLGFRIRETKVGTQKIDNSKLDFIEMIIALFLVEDKKKRSCFFEEIFLLTDFIMNIALDIPFFILSNVKVDFVDCHIYCRMYIVPEVLLTTTRVKLIRKKEFVAAGFDS